MPTIRQIVREAAQDNYRFSTLVLEIVNSEQFRMKRTPAMEIAQARRGVGIPETSSIWGREDLD